MHQEKRKFTECNKAELQAILKEMGEPGFRAEQIWHWVYTQGVSDFLAMTNIGKATRARLDDYFTLARANVSKNLTAFDGTRKWLLNFGPNQEIETVYIPETDRGTLCVSSQIGCTLSCKFCHTGTQRLVRNLTAGEIIDQVLLAKDMLTDWPASIPGRKLSNIVLMGMGEPLYNYENVAKAMLTIMDGTGIGLSRRRITLSTSGVVPMIERCGSELGVNLAISLHAVTDELRDVLVPLNKKYPLSELLAACRNYPAASNAQRITFEYVMLKDVNDSLADAKALVKLIAGIPAKVNLIPFNPWPGTSYECSTPATIKAFSEVVLNAGYASPVRTPRGEDILAACGQLRSESVKKRKSELLAEAEAAA